MGLPVIGLKDFEAIIASAIIVNAIIANAIIANIIVVIIFEPPFFEKKEVSRILTATTLYG